MRISAQTMRVRGANRMLSRLFGAAGVAAILCSTLLCLRFLIAGPGVVVEEPTLVLQDLIPQRDYDLAFRIHNRTGRAVRVVGGPCFT